MEVRAGVIGGVVVLVVALVEFWVLDGVICLTDYSRYLGAKSDARDGMCEVDELVWV